VRPLERHHQESPPLVGRQVERGRLEDVLVLDGDSLEDHFLGRQQPVGAEHVSRHGVPQIEEDPRRTSGLDAVDEIVEFEHRLLVDISVQRVEPQR
jgi:hypothetical protein